MARASALRREKADRAITVADMRASGPPASDKDPSTLSLTALLRHQLVRVENDTNVSWAEQLVEVWIAEALEGNFRALQEVLVRIEGDGPSQDSTALAPPPIDEQTAYKILEALCDRNDDPPSD